MVLEKEFIIIHDTRQYRVELSCIDNKIYQVLFINNVNNVVIHENFFSSYVEAKLKYEGYEYMTRREE